jgi:phycocyanobilin lyase alpha subunit
VLSIESRRLEEKQSQPNQPSTPSDDAGNLTIEKAIAHLRGDDRGLRMYAAWWLGRFRVNQPEVIEVLIESLWDEDDRTSVGGYPLRRNAARALGKLNNPAAVAPLTESLRCSDFYVREAAAQALEQLGDRTCVPMLLKLLRDEVPDTLPAQGSNGLAQPYDAILEALGGLGAIEAMPLIEPFLKHEVERVQYAAARAMYQLSDPAIANQYGDILVEALQRQELQLRRTALADLGAIGYLPAAEAIAKTLAENSLKLIALKGMLEKHLETHVAEHEQNGSPGTPPPLSEQVAQVMHLMDELL